MALLRISHQKLSICNFSAARTLTLESKKSLPSLPLLTKNWEVELCFFVYRGSLHIIVIRTEVAGTFLGVIPDRISQFQKTFPPESLSLPSPYLPGTVEGRPGPHGKKYARTRQRAEPQGPLLRLPSNPAFGAPVPRFARGLTVQKIMLGLIHLSWGCS